VNRSSRPTFLSLSTRISVTMVNIVIDVLTQARVTKPSSTKRQTHRKEWLVVRGLAGTRVGQAPNGCDNIQAGHHTSHDKIGCVQRRFGSQRDGKGCAIRCLSQLRECMRVRVCLKWHAWQYEAVAEIHFTSLVLVHLQERSQPHEG
jgi:hypothetical protein